MDNLLKADIFFFVATVALAIITVFLTIALIYLVKLLRDARKTVQVVRIEAENISEDVEMIREKIHSSDLTWISLFSLFKNLRNRKGRKKIK